MTIQTTSNKNEYVGNGSIVDFDYQYPIRDAAHMAVYLDGVLLGSGYSVSGVGSPTGGTVTLNTPPASGAVVTLLRVVPLTQQTDYAAYDAFPEETHEQALDKLTEVTQQLTEADTRQLGRAPGVPNWDAQGRRITNAADAVDEQDVPTLTQTRDVAAEVAALAKGANIVQETMPTDGLFNGLRWYKPSDAVTYVYYIDEDGAQWVEEAVQSAEGTLREEMLGAPDKISLSFPTLDEALVSNLKAGAKVEIREYTAGFGGLSDWIVKPSSGANGIDKVQLTSDSELMLELVVDGDTVKLDNLGIGNGGDDTARLQRAAVLAKQLIGNPSKVVNVTGVVTFAQDTKVSNAVIGNAGGTLLFQKSLRARFVTFHEVFLRHRSANDIDMPTIDMYRCTVTANTSVSDNISIWGGNKVRYTNVTFDGNSLRHLKLLPLFPDAGTTAASMTTDVKFAKCTFKGTAQRQIIDCYSGASDVLIEGCTVDVQAETFFEHKLKGEAGTPYQTKHTNIRSIGNVIKIGGASCLGVFVIQGAYGAVGTSQTTFQTFKSIKDEITVTVINNSSAPIDVRGFNSVEIDSTVKHGNTNLHPSVQLGSNEVAKVCGGYYDGHIDASAVSYSGQPSSPGYTLLGKQLSVYRATVRDYKQVAGVNAETYATVRVDGCDLGTALTSGASAVTIRNATNIFCMNNTHPSLGTNRLNIVGSPTLIVNKDNSWALPIRSGDSAFTYNGESFYNTATSSWSIKVAGTLVKYNGTV